MGKDSKGINRGKCSKPGCDCIDFVFNKDKGIKCSNCGHVPIAHAEIRFEQIIKPYDGLLESASEDEIEPLIAIDEVEVKETYEDAINDLSEDSGHQPTGSNKDIRGTLRGECTANGCMCKQFLYIAQQGPKCSVCGHGPARHKDKGANVPARLVSKGREENEEKDSVPNKLFIESQNRTFYSRSSNTGVSDLSIDDMEDDPTDSPPVVHMPQFRLRKRLPMRHEPDPIRDVPLGSSSSGSHPTVYPQSRSPNMIDSSMVPVYDQTAYDQTAYDQTAYDQTAYDQTAYGQTAFDQSAVYPHNTLLQANQAPANLVTQNLAGFHTQQQQQPIAMPTNAMPRSSMATNSMTANPMPTNATLSPPAQPTIPQPPVQQQKICKLDGCTQPVYVENDRVHDFCGRKHAVAFKAAGVPAHLKCSNPSCARMKYQEKGKYLDFCGKSCRDSYRKAQQLPAPQLQAAAGPPVSPANTCLLPGCKMPKYFDSTTNKYHDYCGKNHALQAQKTVIRKASKQEFDKINAHFTKEWRKGTCGQLHEVLVITNLKLKNQFEKYRASLSVKTVGQHFHGTSLKCAIYQSCTVCSDETCGICGVSQKGMLQNFKATNITFQRFGNGFYLAPNSSKCHDYTRGHDKYRAMLLFDVAEGNKYIVKDNQTRLKAPPQGYNSVYGQSGSALNYDEIVLYKSEALLPTHILVYMKDGIHKIAK